MKKLIVTADDFGAALQVNDAVEQGHRDGILTAASLMVSAPAAADAVARAKTNPRLRVGLHVVLVEGKPTLPAASVPDLVDASGNFRTDMARSAANMFFFPKVRHQLEAEIEAQFDAFRATGLNLDHVNTHKHFHLHPTIASTILRVGKRHGLRAIRVPLEPQDVLRRAEPGGKLPSALATAPWANLSRARLRAAGLRVPDQVFGLAWSGAMTPARLLGLIENLPDGLSEIYLHPATGPYPGSAPGYRYTEELAALIAPRVVEASRNSAISKGGFADF
ncbi:MAG TPA: hopanoid biosynthesis-associated protein HpnK [Rhizomicrobium sp.]|jgi:hopanoid biosynthesis associated protein HpnK|nr:hopanoid biosynthesis-associated protein HpnK [Rhizomicrobium sp.]